MITILVDLELIGMEFPQNVSIFNRTEKKRFTPTSQHDLDQKLMLKYSLQIQIIVTYTYSNNS